MSESFDAQNAEQNAEPEEGALDGRPPSEGETPEEETTGAQQAPAEETPKGQLTPEEIAAEERLMEGIPRLNIGALFMPGIWGPVHGLWVSILFYPLWLFADNTFYSAFTYPTAMSIAFAVIVFVLMAAVQIAFAILGQPFAARRAAAKNKTRQQYLKEQRIWAVICVVIGVAFLVIATYYNLAVRPYL